MVIFLLLTDIFLFFLPKIKGQIKGQKVVSPLPTAPLIFQASPSPIKPTPAPILSPKAPSKEKPKKEPKEERPAPIVKEFKWGVVVRPYALGRFEIDVWNQQLDLVKELGVEWVRVGWQQWDDPQVNDKIIDAILNKGLKIVLGFEPKRFEEVENPWGNGNEMAKLIASRYCGKINYYQLLNEVASSAIKSGGHSGIPFSDYDLEKYRRLASWLAGASRGVEEVCPRAKRVINDQWVHTGFFDQLVFEDRIPFEILGWNWFSDMGPTLEGKTAGKGIPLLKKLKSYGKELWLVEVNTRGGTEHLSEDKQSDYIKGMAQYAKKAGFSGFFVFELLDLPVGGNKKPEYNGLVKFKIDPNDPERYLPADKKKAFQTYKEVITQ